MASLTSLKTAATAATQTASQSVQPRFLGVARTLVPVAALGIGFVAMKRAHASAIGPYGLIQALPPYYYAALALAGLSFLITWNSSRARPLRLSFDLLVLVFLLQSPPAIIEPEARFPVAWLTAGFTDFVAGTGHVLPGIDARFSWPGFFAGTGMVARAAGLPTTILLLKWWPVALNLLYLPPFYLLARAILGNYRRAALATWLFPLANWVGQDYFSPQSVAFLLYLVFAWIIVYQFGAKRRKLLPSRPEWLHPSQLGRLRPRELLPPELRGLLPPPPAWLHVPQLLPARPAWLRPPRLRRLLPSRPAWLRPPRLRRLLPSRPGGLVPWQLRRWLTRPGPPQEDPPSLPQPAMPLALALAILIALGIAMIVSHQITPIFAGLIVTLLAFFGRTRLKTFGPLLLLLAAGWICFAAIAFWVGHFGELFGGLGNLGGNVNQSIASRIKGSPQHIQVLDVRLLVSLLIWGLMGLGMLAGYRRRLEVRTPAILAIAPLLVLSGGAYGGEAGLRAYLFSLAGALPLVTMLFPVVKSVWSSVAAALITALLVPGFVLARWGNEFSEMTRPGDLAAIRYLYRHAHAGASLMSMTPEVPWRFTDIQRYHYSLDNLETFLTKNVGAMVKILAGNPRGGYVLITTGEVVLGEQTYGEPKDWGTQLEHAIASSHRFIVVYSAPGERIYKLSRVTHGG